MIREIVLDTETTGLDPKQGDRVVEIGGVELINHVPTGEAYHVYINPERPMSQGAFEVHGLSDEFLSDKPVFGEIAGAFAEFIKDAVLVIHNAPFDVGFLDHEFGLLNMPPIVPENVIDTLALARRKHPAGPNSLDALCSRYNIDNSKRTKHGALLDADLLAEVYIELIGGRQADLGLVDQSSSLAYANQSDGAQNQAAKPRPEKLPARLTTEEIEAHEAFVKTLGDDALWTRYQNN